MTSSENPAKPCDRVFALSEWSRQYFPGNLSCQLISEWENQVNAPAGEALAKIHAAVLKRARWITRHVNAARTLREDILRDSARALPSQGAQSQLALLPSPFEAYAKLAASKGAP